MAASMVHRQIDGVWVVVHGKGRPESAEWTAMVRDLAVARAAETPRPTLVFTAGGGPDAKQRSELNSVLGREPGPTAIVSVDPAVRLIAGAVSLFVPRVKVFGPEAIEDAFDHIRVPHARRRGLLRAARVLAPAVGEPRLTEALGELRAEP